MTIATDSIERFTEELKTLADQLRCSTVQVRGHQDGIGSGVIWSADGVIVTNAHVIQGDSINIELSDRRVLQATVIAKSLQRDLAALKVNATDLPVAPIGDSDQVRVGELAIAIGNPLGMVGALTTGIVHNLGSTNFSRRHWIQADVQLAPGNSGGPLANAQGQVIGINTMIVDGKGFAVPSNVVQRFCRRKINVPIWVWHSNGSGFRSWADVSLACSLPVWKRAARRNWPNFWWVIFSLAFEVTPSVIPTSCSTFWKTPMSEMGYR